MENKEKDFDEFEEFEQKDEANETDLFGQADEQNSDDTQSDEPDLFNQADEQSSDDTQNEEPNLFSQVDEQGSGDADIEEIQKEKAAEPAIRELLEQQERETTSESMHFDKPEKEPGSGLLDLAGLVAKATVEQTVRPSVPPMIGAFGRRNDDRVLFEIATSDIPPPVYSSKKKIIVPVFATMAVVFVGAFLAIIAIQNKRDNATREVQEAKLALLEFQVQKAEAQRAKVVQQISEPAAALQPAVSEPKVEAKTGEIPAKETAVKQEEKAPARTTAAPAKQVSNGDSDDERTSSRSRSKKQRQARASKASEETSRQANNETPAKTSSKTNEPSKSDSSGSLSKSDIAPIMNIVVSQVSTCAKFATGTIPVRITIAPNGSVESCRSMGAFANTQTGRCVEGLVKSARFPKPGNGSFTFTYPVSVR